MAEICCCLRNFAAYSCSMELCLNSKSERKNQYLNYFMHRINLVRHYNITPVVVFDGGNIPRKAATEDERHRHVVHILLFFCLLVRLTFRRSHLLRLCWLFRRREANRDLAMEKLKQGNVKAAVELFQVINTLWIIYHEFISLLLISMNLFDLVYLVAHCGLYIALLSVWIRV